MGYHLELGPMASFVLLQRKAKWPCCRVGLLQMVEVAIRTQEVFSYESLDLCRYVFDYP